LNIKIDYFYCSISNSSGFINDPTTLIDFEREYNLKIRQEFDLIENEISELIKQKRQNYEQIRKMIQ
jgi:hypothetical protein